MRVAAPLFVYPSLFVVRNGAFALGQCELFPGRRVFAELENGSLCDLPLEASVIWLKMLYPDERLCS